MTGSLTATQAQARLVAAQDAVAVTGRDLKTAQQAYDVTAADFAEAVDYADAVTLQSSCGDDPATAAVRVVLLHTTRCIHLQVSSIKCQHW